MELPLDSDHGFPTAILDASEITAIRTAAVSGLATRQAAFYAGEKARKEGPGIEVEIGELPSR